MKKAIQAIIEFIPGSEQEETDKKLFLECATNIDNSLTRDSLLFHFTSSAFVINDKKDKVVSAYHNIYKSWSWLGGHADGDDDFLHVAKKEVEEESGISNVRLYKNGIFSLESLPVSAHFKRGKYVPAHIHLNVTYVFIANEKDNLRIAEDENSNIAWIPFDELIKRSTEGYMKPVYKKIIDKINMLEKRNLQQNSNSRK